MAPTRPVHIVDNRVFLLGLDALYRRLMKHHERTELLPYAREIAAVLHVAPATGPVEGYYVDDALLTEYFQLIRALQVEPNRRVAEIDKRRAYQRLYAVTSAPLFGRVRNEDKLLPQGHDSLSEALEQRAAREDLTIPAVTARAERVARERDDYSLVGLAARTRDAIVLTALRESVVLYARLTTWSLSMLPRSEPVFEWHVSPELAKQANRFIDAFNKLFPGAPRLPQAAEEHADVFWDACDLSQIVGRCVRIGYDDRRLDKHYHWAIKRSGAELEVEDFWAPDIWTTQRYRRERLHMPTPPGRLEGLDGLHELEL